MPENGVQYQLLDESLELLANETLQLPAYCFEEEWDWNESVTFDVSGILPLECQIGDSIENGDSYGSLADFIDLNVVF